MSHPDYSQITESPGLQATAEQLERIYHRYRFAKPFCKGKDVIEVACGSGIGLGYLASFSNSVIGCDIDEKNLLMAQAHHSSNPKIRIEKQDAHQLTFSNNSCDAMLLYEAIYYLKHPEKFFSESHRILKDKGVLIICSVNKDLEDFHPSPYTHQYFSVPQFYEMIKKDFKEVRIYGAFKIEEDLKAKMISFIKRTAVKLNLIPGSLRLRAYFKRIFIGKTLPLPGEISEDMAGYTPPIGLPVNEINKFFKILYIVAQK